MFRRRRPLLAATMIGGTAYAAGRAGQRVAQREDDEQARIAELEEQVYQQQQQQQAPPPAPAAAPAAAQGQGIADQLERLAMLKNSGVLTQDEFDAAKQKLLAG